MKKVDLNVAMTGLGVLLYLKTKDCNEFKEINARVFLDLETYKEVCEEFILKCEEQEETEELIQTIVSGPLIDRLIKNEELKLSKEVKENDRTNIIKTITDLKKLKMH